MQFEDLRYASQIPVSGKQNGNWNPQRMEFEDLRYASQIPAEFIHIKLQ